MSLETQIGTCNERYSAWKNKAMFTNDIREAKKAVERAFFWMELRSALLFLMSVENSGKDNAASKEKILRAKMNLSRKLSEHTKELLK